MTFSKDIQYRKYIKTCGDVGHSVLHVEAGGGETAYTLPNMTFLDVAAVRLHHHVMSLVSYQYSETVRLEE